MWPFNNKSKPVNTYTEKSIQEVLNSKDMEYYITNENGLKTNLPFKACIGTSGQGRLKDADYKLLKALFGQPDTDYQSGDGKIRKHWTISIDGVVCTIYDWKQGRRYSNTPLKYSTWSVGGSTPLSRRLVQGVIDASYRGYADKITRME